MKQLVEELELDNCDFLNQPGRRKQVKELVEEFHDIFTTEERKVGMVPDKYRTTIKLKPGTVPIKQKLRPMHPQQQAELKTQLDEWLKEGVIRPSKSPWASLSSPSRRRMAGPGGAPTTAKSTHAPWETPSLPPPWRRFWQASGMGAGSSPPLMPAKPT